jgi:hypothetical protein
VQRAVPDVPHLAPRAPGAPPARLMKWGHGCCRAELASRSLVGVLGLVSDVNLTRWLVAVSVSGCFGCL